MGVSNIKTGTNRVSYEIEMPYLWYQSQNQLYFHFHIIKVLKRVSLFPAKQHVLLEF